MIKTKLVKASRCVPKMTVSNFDLEGMLDTNDEWIFSHTGIKRRHISTGETTSELAAGAFSRLLEGTEYNAQDIELLIVTTVTPDYLTPATACIVQKAVGAKNAFAFDINAACTGFVFALSVADKFIRSGMCKNAVIVSADTLSKIVDWTDRSTCILFGDGAGAVLLEASDSGGILAEDLHSDGDRAHSLAGHSLPQQNVWIRVKAEQQPYVRMDGRDIFDFTVREVPKSVNRALELAGLGIGDISRIVPHQANARLIEGVAKKLKTDISKFYINIHEYGNTSSASIPIALSEMLENGVIKPGSGEKLLLAGYGGGLTWGSIVFQL